MITEVLEKKQELIKELEKEIRKEERIKFIKKDAHTKRLPIGCGMTVHMGFNCPFSCSYCYIKEMGFDFKPTTPYPLNGKDLALALLYNPAFVPGKMGTFIALGSVSDPLYPTVIPKTLEFIKTIATHLKNPVQFSTKNYLNPSMVSQIREASRGATISPLITIITINFAQQIESRAPSPSLRFKTIENLKDADFKPFTFIRPIIPGITDIESSTILEESKTHGATGIVAGALRVNKAIVKRLKEAEVNVREIKKRLKIALTRKQVSIDVRDLKQKILEEASKLGLLAYNSACCANAFTAGVPCFGLCYLTKRCVRCPNDCINKLPTINTDEIQNYIASYLQMPPRSIDVTTLKTKITVSLRDKKITPNQKAVISTFLKTVTRRFVIVKK